MAGIIPAASSRSPNDRSNTTRDEDKIESKSAAVRRGRRPKFTAEEDLIIVCEVSASKAHSASFGSNREHFAVAAEPANANPAMQTSVSSKGIQDRYGKLQALFDRRDAAQRKMSGIGGKVVELE
jgi:hypothetical protein